MNFQSLLAIFSNEDPLLKMEHDLNKFKQKYGGMTILDRAQKALMAPYNCQDSIGLEREECLFLSAEREDFILMAIIYIFVIGLLMSAVILLYQRPIVDDLSQKLAVKTIEMYKKIYIHQLLYQKSD